jgi:hypothetical protein
MDLKKMNLNSLYYISIQDFKPLYLIPIGTSVDWFSCPTSQMIYHGIDNLHTTCYVEDMDHYVNDRKIYIGKTVES